MLNIGKLGKTLFRSFCSATGNDSSFILPNFNSLFLNNDDKYKLENIPFENKQLFKSLHYRIFHSSFSNRVNIISEPEGYGKTTILRRLQKIGNMVDSNLGISYIDLSERKYIEPVLPSIVLEKILKEKLNFKKTVESNDFPNDVEILLNTLDYTKYRLVLLYDNVESIYEKDTVERLRFIKEINVFTNTGFRNCYVVLSGNEDLENLAYREFLDESMKEKYPLKGFDLNRSKCGTLFV